MSGQPKYKIAIWNANGLQQHALEIKTFLIEQKIDIMMISETHFTDRNYIRIPKYNLYHTTHPDNKSHGGTAIIIREDIKHYEREKFEKSYLQATSVTIEDVHGPTTLSAIYCPPKHNNKKVHFEELFNTLGNKFLAGGDYNAKHPTWGSRITTTKGREIIKTMKANNLQQLSTGEPTYWPSDKNKIPDAIDFCITKGIDTKKCVTESNYDLSSDHSLVIITVYSKIPNKVKQPSLYNGKTNWNVFRDKLDNLISLDQKLKTELDIEIAVENLTKNIQEAAWLATPDYKTLQYHTETCPTIKEKIAVRRRLRKQWQRDRTEDNKKKLNKATKELKTLIGKKENQSLQDYLENLTSTQETEHSLWKATRRLSMPQLTNPPIKNSNNNWARSDQEKAEVFAKYLQNVFKPFPSEITTEEEKEIIDYLDTPLQMEVPIRKFTKTEITQIVRQEINIKKAPGFDLITGKILQELSEKCFKLITFIFNAMLRVSYFPCTWKVAQIIMIPKPGKKPEDVTSYRPISLLPILSKVFEKLYVKRLKLIINQKKLIPDHQFGFRDRHGTIEQVHRLVNQINKDLNAKRYCSAAFLDVSQAFDRVWHTGLQFKLKTLLPHPHYQLLKSYLTDRQFLVKQGSEYTDLHLIHSGVPQGSVLGPTLFLLYTADMPKTRTTTIATYADDTAILASHIDPVAASRNLQTNLNCIQKWLKTWRIRVNETKSTHVTFTLGRETCPPVKINNCIIPQAEDAKYLGMYLDRRLTWKKHIFTKRKQLGIKLRKMYWLIGRKSRLSLENKLLLYKSILKPVWTYGIQLWGTASNSNIEILQRFQNKVIRAIVDAPYYVSNKVIQHDIRMESIREVIHQYSASYSERVLVHPNVLVNQLNVPAAGEVRRLKRLIPSDLVMGSR